MSVTDTEIREKVGISQQSVNKEVSEKLECCADLLIDCLVKLRMLSKQEENEEAG